MSATASKPENTTKTNLSKAELQAEVRRLRLELQGYRVYGTPMEIAIKLESVKPVCYWCQFRIESQAECAIVETAHGRYWLHHDCLDRGVDLIRDVEMEIESFTEVSPQSPCPRD